MRLDKQVYRVVAGAMLAIASVACGASGGASLDVEMVELPREQPTAPVTIGRSHYIPGENMSFEVSLRGVLGGYTHVAVGEPGLVGDKRAIIVKSRVESAGVAAFFKEVRDQVETWVDMDSGHVIKLETHSVFGEKSSIIATDLGAGTPGPFILDYTRKGRRALKVRQMLPKEAHAYDLHAVLGLLRAWRADDGQEANFFLLSGRRLWRSSVVVGAHETIRTSMGKMPAIRIDGVAQRVTRGLRDEKNKKPRHFSVWLSDDASRLPLLVMAKTEYGSLQLELKDYSRPDQRLSSR